MIHFFGDSSTTVFAVQFDGPLSKNDIPKLTWLFGNANKLVESEVSGSFIGPRAAMVTPWSTNAVEITQNMGIMGIVRIEKYVAATPDSDFDPMLNQKYASLNQGIFTINIAPEKVQLIEDVDAYNESEGLALSPEEVDYLKQVSQRIGRKLTDAEVFGFSQINSEHCRHKIFNGVFSINEEDQPSSLFKLIKKTSQENPNGIVSAYKDNVAFVKGPKVNQFAPASPDKPSNYYKTLRETVVSLKAETHNFPTTVEPFNGAATGSGGEIRDRMAGGKGSLPLAGTAVYMTSYPRFDEAGDWVDTMPARKWLYQSPIDILIKASNGASDFGNKFGQPLISGSLLTFEHEGGMTKWGYDKVIMLAGGVGAGILDQALKDKPSTGDKIVLLGGDNYRIGMGGAAVSSADTGEFSSGIELNAVQRSNPEMQKRVANTIRALVESSQNPVIALHDHGAGGHLNCFSELVEEVGGRIDLDQLPIGDPTLSSKEIIGNESQERMGLIVAEKDLDLLRRIADRERAPMYVVGEVTGDMRFTIKSEKKQETPMDMALEDLFGSSPVTIMKDDRINHPFDPGHFHYQSFLLEEYLKNVLALEAVACKDWLTNKVDRCVGGLVAKQQCAGPLQLPLNNAGVMALGFDTNNGVATSIGHAPIAGLIDAAAGSRNAVAESLTNLVWVPLEEGLKSVSLSANWMWPCRNPGEDARLYEAVEALSSFCIELGINVPTGKDSLSMKQKYPNQDDVLSPGTVIVSSVGVCSDINQIVEPVFQRNAGPIIYVNLSQDAYHLGGSSFAQVLNRVGNECPDIKDAKQLAAAFNAIQDLVKEGAIVAGHDVSAGGLITALLEMCFADVDLGAKINLSSLEEADTIKLYFAENSGLVFQLKDEDTVNKLRSFPLPWHQIGFVTDAPTLVVTNGKEERVHSIAELRDTWFSTSKKLDEKQTANGLAETRFQNYSKQPLKYIFPSNSAVKLPVLPTNTAKPKAAILREKGSNSERELAHALYLAGFEVRDVHMTDLMSGRETLEDIQFLGAVGGFSNSDVLGSAKGWAGTFKYNEKAKKALDDFFAREDVLSIGICNGCQLFVELGLINPDHEQPAKMLHNDSQKHESGFTSVEITPNNSVMLSSLVGSKLGVWISHGEGKFHLPQAESDYHIVAKYGYEGYPANPNGSDYNTAMMASKDGRHLVTMPHIERSIFPWNWAHYPKDRNDEISPWIEAFVNAREWLEKQ